MKLLVALVGALCLLLVTAFCVFGFLATFEPTKNAMAFRIGYAVLGVVCLAGAGCLVVNGARK